MAFVVFSFFFSSRRRHTRYWRDWSSDVCSSDLRVRLDVRVLGAEQRLGALDRQRLDHVDVLAAAVVALAGQALGVLVGQHRALALEDRLRDEVLGRDHLERRLLAMELALDRVGDLGVDLGERALEVVGMEVAHATERITGSGTAPTRTTRRSPPRSYARRSTTVD